MNRWLIPLIPVLCLVAGCERQAQRTAPTEPRNSLEEQLRTLPAPARNLALRNAIIDSGVRCERVDPSAFQQRYKGTTMWLAHCTNKGDFAVFVSPAGYAQVVPCGVLPAAGAPACAWPEGAAAAQ